MLDKLHEMAQTNSSPFFNGFSLDPFPIIGFPGKGACGRRRGNLRAERPLAEPLLRAGCAGGGRQSQGFGEGCHLEKGLKG